MAGRCSHLGIKPPIVGKAAILEGTPRGSHSRTKSAYNKSVGRHEWVHLAKGGYMADWLQGNSVE